MIYIAIALSINPSFSILGSKEHKIKPTKFEVFSADLTHAILTVTFIVQYIAKDGV